MDQAWVGFYPAGDDQVDGQRDHPVRPKSPMAGEAMGVSKCQDDMTLFEAMEEDLVGDMENRKNAIREMEMETEVVNVPRGFSKMHTPSPDEFAKHCLTHLPYRNWCPICVQSKKRNPRHQRIKEGRGVPIFGIDYMFLNGEDNLSYPIVVINDSESGGIWAVPVMRKGN